MSNFRSPKLLNLAKEAPRCMSCGTPNDGTVVACHSNSLRHGKGTGIKAHDLIAFGCQECHDLLDGRLGNLTRLEKDVMFQDAFFFTTLWWLQSGHLQVVT